MLGQQLNPTSNCDHTKYIKQSDTLKSLVYKTDNNIPTKNDRELQFPFKERHSKKCRFRPYTVVSKVYLFNYKRFQRE